MGTVLVQRDIKQAAYSDQAACTGQAVRAEHAACTEQAARTEQAAYTEEAAFAIRWLHEQQCSDVDGGAGETNRTVTCGTKVDEIHVACEQSYSRSRSALSYDGFERAHS